jgi:tetratricopeptide (TPR) repeat protein
MRILLSIAVIILAVLGPPSAAQTRTDRERARIQNRLAWEQMRAEQWAAAARAFQQAIDIDPTYQYAHYGLGRARMGLKAFTDAITALERCRSLYEAEGGRQFASAQDAQRYRRDRLIEIDEQIRQLQSGPQNLQSQDLLRQFQTARRDLQDRIERGNSMTLESSVPAFVTLSLGSAYFRAGRLADAEREYKATILTDSKSGEAYNNLAVVYLETGRFAEAEASLAAAKKAGLRVSAQLEQEIRSRKKSSG